MSKRCSKCNGLGHNSRTCGKQKKEVPKKRSGKRICGHCGIEGHNKRTCPKIHGERVVKPIKKSDRICSLCHKPGHNRRTCLSQVLDKMPDKCEIISFLKTKFKDEDDFLNSVYGVSYEKACSERAKYPHSLVRTYYTNGNLDSISQDKIRDYYLFLCD